MKRKSSGVHLNMNSLEIKRKYIQANCGFKVLYVDANSYILFRQKCSEDT